MKNAILVLCLILGMSFNIFAQVTSINYLIEYNDSLELYDCKIVINAGSATTYPERVQFNSQYTIVVPSGTVLQIDTLFNPKEDNQFYTGTIPCLWEFGPKEFSPPASPLLDFHSVSPNLSPISSYHDLYPGDTITLFSIYADIDPCENSIRPFENGSDPSSIEMPSGGDFSNGFTLGGFSQLYSANSYIEYEQNNIICNGILEICIGDCTILEPTISDLGDSLTYEWSTGETTETIEVCPSQPTNYYLWVKDNEGNYLDSIPVFVDLVHPYVDPELTTVCAGDGILLESCPGDGIWSQSSSNGFGAFVSPLSGGVVEVTFSEFASGSYDLIYGIPGFSDTISITVNPAPLVNVANSQICIGESTVAAANIPGGTWESNHPDIAIYYSNTNLIYGVGAGSATFTYTSPTGCTATTSPLIVTSGGEAEFLGPDHICIGETTIVSPGTGGTWVSADQSIATVTNTGIATGVGHGVATLTFINTSDGCHSNSLELYVEPLYTEITGPKGICIGETTTITPSTGGTWSSSDDSVAAIDNSGNITGIGAGSATFTFTSSTSQCFSFPSEPVYVDINAQLEIEASELCIGETTQLTSDTEGFWLSDNPAVATVHLITGEVTAVSSGIVSFTLDDETFCSSSFVSLLVYPIPDVEILGPSVICAGGTTFMSPNSGGQWTSSDPSIVTFTNSGVGTGVQAGTVHAVYTDWETGCVSDPIEITVLGSLSTPSTNNNGPLCVGDDIALTTDHISGASYEWTGPGGFVSTDQNPIIFSATVADAGNYCVVVSIDGCSSNTGCTDVYVMSTPATPTVSNNSPVCEGEDLQFATAAVAGANYTWTGPNGFTSSNQNPIIFNGYAGDSGTYCVVVTVNGCDSAPGCTDMVVKPTPNTPVASNNSPLCEDEDLHLTTDYVAGAIYSWTGPNGFTSSDQNPTLAGVNPSESGMYCVLINVDGCESLEGCTVVIINPTFATPAAQSNSPICEGEDLKLYTDAVIGATYAWTGPDGFTSTNQNPVISNVSPLYNGTYCVLINVDGCESLEGCTDVIINPTFATPVVHSNGPICEEEDLELTVSTVANATYLWTGPNGYTSSDQNPIINYTNVNNSGTYCVKVTTDGCAGQVICTDVIIKPKPSYPMVSQNGPICEGEDLQLTIEDVTGATYAWTGSDGFTSTEQNLTISDLPSFGAVFCVVVTVDGCQSIQECTDVFITPTPQTPIANNNGPLCEGQILELTTDEVPGVTYLWTGPTGITYHEQNPVILPGAGQILGTYSLVLDFYGCESLEATTEVTKKTFDHDVVISNNTPVCIGDVVALSVEEIEGASYSWDSPNGATYSGSEISFVAEASTQGPHRLILSYDGCTYYFNTEVELHAPIDPIVLENDVLCVGESTDVFPNSGGTYTFSNPNIGIISGSDFVALNSGTTDLVYTSDLNGCESEPVSITVFNCIEPVSSCEEISADDIICDFNDLKNIGGTLSNEFLGGNQPIGELCDDGDEVHNISWLGFVALEGDYEIVVHTSNCIPYVGGEVGVQVGVYSECNFSDQTKVFCESKLGLENEIRIPSSILSKGETYFLYIDGFEQSVCDYYIDVDGFYDNTYCTDLSKVTGVAYVDDNENGIYEEGETLLRNALISLSPGNFSVLTNNEGKYIINTPKGGATLTAKMNEGHWINNELTISDLTIFETCVEGINFGFVPNLFYSEANISVANTVTRCDWETRFYFTVENTGTINLDAKFEFDFDSKASYFATNLIGLQVNGDVASANLGIIEPFEVREYWIKLKMPSGSAVMPVLDFKTTLYNSADIVMDEYEHSEQLRCSYDPNDKREYPNREGEDNLTLMDEDIQYTIRFQNNGNDTAFLVKIVDPIDPNIDPTSIRVISSSHPVETCIEAENLIFLFEDINLVDSMTNYEGSQGFVSFKCSTKEGRSENTIVHNTADIIFDTNVPIVTNTTINTLVSELCTYVTSEIDVEICEGDNYNGHEESGIYTEIYPLAYGCDSIVVVNLDVQGITYSSQQMEVCEGEPFEINDVEYILYETEKITDTLHNAQGCISNVFIFNVKVNPIELIDIDATICEGLDYNGWTESGVYTIDSFDTVTGCDILTTVHLEVLPLSDPLCIVGTEELASTEVKIYPNPARDAFYLEGDFDINTVSIYNMEYQKLKEVAFNNGGNRQRISTSELSVGLYIVAVKSENAIIYKKLIIE